MAMTSLALPQIAHEFLLHLRPLLPASTIYSPVCSPGGRSGLIIRFRKPFRTWPWSDPGSLTAVQLTTIEELVVLQEERVTLSCSLMDLRFVARYLAPHAGMMAARLRDACGLRGTLITADLPVPANVANVDVDDSYRLQAGPVSLLACQSYDISRDQMILSFGILYGIGNRRPLSVLEKRYQEALGRRRAEVAAQMQRLRGAA
jgi:hypothetical protein